jgi:hypothetical protein
MVSTAGGPEVRRQPRHTGVIFQVIDLMEPTAGIEPATC